MKICGLGDVLLPRCTLEGLWTTTKTFSGNCPVEDWKRKPYNYRRGCENWGSRLWMLLPSEMWLCNYEPQDTASLPEIRQSSNTKLSLCVSVQRLRWITTVEDKFHLF